MSNYKLFCAKCGGDLARLPLRTSPTSHAFVEGQLLCLPCARALLVPALALNCQHGPVTISCRVADKEDVLSALKQLPPTARLGKTRMVQVNGQSMVEFEIVAEAAQ